MLKIDWPVSTMKTQLAKQRNQALTFFELLVVIALLAVLVAMLLPTLAANMRRSARINCVSNLKQVNLSFRIWESDNNNLYPMGVSLTNGGAMELVATGNVAGCFQVMSNELSTTKILICPNDTNHTFATNFGNDFNNSHISYFVGVDVTNANNPNMVLDGDDNFTLNGSPVKLGIFQFSTNALIIWGPGRHGDVGLPRHFWMPPPHIFFGNLGFADGSVAEESDSGLQAAFQSTGLATNRLAIP